MRLLVVVENHGGGGGAGVLAASSARAMADAGHTVRVIAGAAAPGADDVLVLDDLAAARVRPATAAALREVIGDFAPDVVHVHDLHDMDLVREIGVSRPVVWSVHNFSMCSAGFKHFRDGAVCFKPHGPGCAVNWVAKGCAHRRDLRPLARQYRETSDWLAAVRAAGAVVVYSRFMAGQLGLNAVERVHVVAATAPTPPSVTPPPAARKAVFVGRLTEYKGLLVLLEAMRRVRGSLDVCGSGWALEKAVRFVADHGLGERVTFHGWLSAADTARRVDAADVVVVPSVWPEPFGMAALEAMGRGRPVVASRIGGLEECVVDGSTGLLVAPSDPAALAVAIERLLDDPELAARVGGQGRAHAQAAFSPAEHVRQMESVYASAAPRREAIAPR